MRALNCTPYEMLIENIVGSDGCYLFDDAGQRYVDLESGVWCTALGHNNPQVNRTLCDQIGKISHVGYRYSCKVVERAAGMILDLLNMPEAKCVFLSSGSEAVEFAVQAAQRVCDDTKPYTLHLHSYFLSSYGQSAARPAERWISLDLSGMDPAGQAAAIDCLPFDRIGAFVFEPGNASGLVRLPPQAAVAQIASRLKESGGLIVVDEVTTGIGRTGRWFGFEHYDLSPDLVACGKGMGNGYPVSCVAMRDEIATRLLATGFHYAQSHQNDPLGAAVACSVLSQIADRNLVNHAAAMGARLLAQLDSLAAESSLIHEVRGRGLMIAVELCAKAPLMSIHRTLCARGYLVGTNVANRVLRIYPPLIVDAEILDGFVRTLREVLADHQE